jgi:hypothetical protein
MNQKVCGSSCVLFKALSQPYDRDWGKLRETQIKMTGPLTEIRNRDLHNMKQGS